MAKSVSQLKNEARREEQRENWSRAIELYREAIRLSEETGEVSLDLSLYNRVGDLYRRQGETDRAVGFYHEAVERYAEQGLHTGAIALCNKILRLAPDRVEVHRSLGRLHAATGLVAEARNSFAEYCDRLEEEGRHEERRRARLELARLVEDREGFLEAIDEMLEAGEDEPAVEALVDRWEEGREAGEELPGVRERLAELAPAALEEAAEEEPAEDESAEEGPPSEEPAPSSPPEEAGTDAAASAEPEGGGDEAEPSELSDILLELDDADAETPADETDAPPESPGDEAVPPEEPDADDEVAVHLRYAEVLERSGQVGAAVEQLEEVLDESAADGRYEEALEVVDKLRELAPERTAHLRRRAELLEEVGADDEAVEAWMELGRELGGPSADRARSAYVRALELAPGHEQAREALERTDAAPAAEGGEEELDELLRDLGALPEARKSGPDAGGEEEAATPDGADEGAGDDERGYVDLGARIRERLRADHEAAGTAAGERDYDFDGMLVGLRAQAEETTGRADPEAHVELGVALRQMGQLDDAIREFQVATRAPEPPLRAFELLGETFRRKELHSVAIRVLNRALRMPGRSDHELLGILYQLGVAHQEIGSAREALDCYERIYSVDIDFRDVGERMRTVRAEV